MNMFSRVIVYFLLLSVSSVFADIERMRVSSNGAQGNGSSADPSLSGDGRFVAFTSFASNLVNNDTNGVNDVFVQDRQTGTTERISVSSSGLQGNGSSFDPSLSGDGRFVAFTSFASNLAESDTNSGIDVFIHDRETGITESVNVSSSGEQGNGSSADPSLSGDGRFVAFVSAASNLVDDDTNAETDIFIHDFESGLTERVSISSNGEQGNIHSSSPSLSRDGRFVAFQSSASNLVDGDTNANTDIFIHDRETGMTQRVNASSSGVQGNLVASEPILSSNGRFVVFNAYVDDRYSTDVIRNIFVHDRETGLTMPASISSSGALGNDDSNDQTISDDGRFVAFRSFADNLVDGDTNAETDIFIHDFESGLTERVSISSNGEQGNSDSFFPSLSVDGRFVAFSSRADNLVDGDTNAETDIFITDNTLINNNVATVETLINNVAREAPDKAAHLSTGTLYRQSYKVTNDSIDRIYQVKVFEDGNLVCNFYALEPGQSRQRCDSFQTVLEGDQHVQVTVMAKVSGSGQELTSTTDAYYTGHTNVTGKLVVTHRINNVNADTADQAPTLGSQQASVLFKVENIGDIELYQVKTYHDPVSPVNSGWDLQCVMGPMKPGQVRYCKKDLILTDSGLNQAIGRVQGRNAIRSATNVVNASNSTYFIAP